ncbi:MAG: hypothetical protein PHH36_12780 [Sideroxydans sp.]|nr:hypothetical protein [Sideroxydans sp.]
MTDDPQLPAIREQVTALVLAGSPEHAEETINDTAEKFGDLAVVEVLNALEPQVASLHLSSFDGGKLSLATMLIPPKAWAESLAYFAATWDEDWIEDEPEALAESLFSHIHGMLYATDDEERRAELLNAALATDWGTTAFAVLFSTASEEIIEIANDIHNLGAHRSSHTTSDHDVIPLALEIARTNEEAWDRILFEIFPDWRPGENELQSHSEEWEEDDHGDEETRESQVAMGRSTQELLNRLRKQVPSKAPATTKPGARPSLGEDIFA